MATVRQPTAPFWKEWKGPIGNLDGSREDHVAVNVVDPASTVDYAAVESWNLLRWKVQTLSHREEFKTGALPTRNLVELAFEFRDLLRDRVVAQLALPAARGRATVYGNTSPVPMDQGPIWWPRRRGVMGTPTPYGAGFILIGLETLCNFVWDRAQDQPTRGVYPKAAANIAKAWTRWADEQLLGPWFGLNMVEGADVSLEEHFGLLARGNDGETHAIWDIELEALFDGGEREEEFNVRVERGQSLGHAWTQTSDNPTHDPELTLRDVGDRVVVLYRGKPYWATVTEVDASEARYEVEFDSGELGNYDFGEVLDPEEYDEEPDA